MVKERCLQRVLRNKFAHRAKALFHLAVLVNLPRLQHGELGLEWARTGLVVGAVEVFSDEGQPGYLRVWPTALGDCVAQLLDKECQRRHAGDEILPLRDRDLVKVDLVIFGG